MGLLQYLVIHDKGNLHACMRLQPNFDEQERSIHCTMCCKNNKY